MSRTVLALLAVGTILLVSAGTTLAQTAGSVLDANAQDGSSADTAFIGGTTWVAQTFVAQNTGRLTDASFRVERATPNTTSIWVQIVRPPTADSPAQVLTENGVSASSVALQGSGGTTLTAHFDFPVTVLKGEEYALRLASSGPGAGWFTLPGGSYSEGRLQDASNNSAWTNLAGDVDGVFGIYVVPDTTPPSVNAWVLETPSEAGWHYQDATVELFPLDNRDGAGVESLTYSASGAKTIPATTTDGRPVRLLFSEEGETTISYSATDHVGNASEEETLTVRIDKTPPTATIESGPDSLTSDDTPAFTLGGSDNLTPNADLRYAYWLDDPQRDWAPPSESKEIVLGGENGLSEGPHTLYVRTLDKANNASMNIAERSFFVDTTPPRTTIVSAPPGLTGSDSADFYFRSEYEPADFQCSLDGADFAPCSTSAFYEDLAEGEHTFKVRATDAVGNVEPTPAKVRWAVDTAAPRGTVTMNDGHDFTDDALVNLALSAEDPHPGSGVGAVSISNNGVDWSWYPYVKNNSWILHGDDGTKTVHVRYYDEAGNFRTTRDRILLDTVSPSGRVDINGGDMHSRSRTVELGLQAKDPSPASGVSSMRLKNAGGEWSAWRPYSVTESWRLSAGAGTKTVYAQYRDSAGNVSERILDNILYLP